MIPEFEPLYAESSSWLALSQLVEQAIQAMPPDSWRPTIECTTPQQATAKQIMQSLFDQFQAHAPAYLAAVRARWNNGEWPELSPPTIYYLRHMHGRLLNFLQGVVLCPHKTPETIFHYPERGKPEDVLYWFQTRWWIEHGALEMMLELSRRHEPPPFSFSKS